ncbi:MAG: hypothetical protein MJY61_04245 [Bacteroidales bacterium]|nr:hypothetical protein [Bacteroidales bacterium]
MKHPLLIIVAVVLIPVACSVKENRMDCPCTLDVSVTGGNESIVTLSMWNPELRHSCDISVGDGWDRHLISVPRGQFRLSACSGLRHDMPGNGILLLKRGEEMDELFAGVENLLALKDSAECSVTLHKQYAQIGMKLLCLRSVELPDSIVVRGNVDGMKLTEMKPHNGDFEVKLHTVLGEFCRVCVPRQTDSSLELEVGDLGTVPLGEYIADSGYDWSREDLPDMEIVIDLLENKIEIKAEDWVESRSLNLII